MFQRWYTPLDLVYSGYSGVKWVTFLLVRFSEAIMVERSSELWSTKFIMRRCEFSSEFCPRICSLRLYYKGSVKWCKFALMLFSKQCEPISTQNFTHSIITICLQFIVELELI